MKPELMIPVEQAIRPLTCSLTRKMQMREELYSLLHDRWQAALSTGKSDEAALLQAVAAFGAPAEIGRELQATVPVFERIAYGAAMRLFSASETPSLQEALRIGTGHAALLALIMLPVILPTVWFRNEQVLFIVPFLLALCLLYGWNSAGAIWLGGRTIASLEDGRTFHAVLQAGLGGIVFAAAYGLFAWNGLEQGITMAVGLRMLGGGLSYAIVFLLVCRELKKERALPRPWLSLSWEN